MTERSEAVQVHEDGQEKHEDPSQLGKGKS